MQLCSGWDEMSTRCIGESMIVSSDPKGSVGSLLFKVVYPLVYHYPVSVNATALNYEDHCSPSCCSVVYVYVACILGVCVLLLMFVLKFY